MASAEQVVRDFCAAVRDRDPGALRAFFSDDVVYHNIPLDPAEGIDATMDMMNSFLVMFEELEFEIHHLASDGSTVLTERTDHFTTNGRKLPCPSWVPSTSSTGRSPHGGTISIWARFRPSSAGTDLQAAGETRAPWVEPVSSA